MAKHKVFKSDEVASEKIARIRRLARDGAKPAEAMTLVAYPGTENAFIRLCRREWRIEFAKNWNRAHEGHVAGGVIA